MAAAITTLARLGIGTGDPVDTRLDFMDFSLGVEDELKDMNGTRGKYTKDGARVRKNLTRVSPSLRCQPTAVELAALLPWILDGTPTGTTYPLGNTTALRNVHFDPNGGSLWKLSNVAVDAATIRASQGEPLEVALDLVGRTYAVSGSFPAISLDLNTQPFLMVDASLTVNGGSAVQFREVSLSVRKNIDRGRYFNSPTLTAQNKLARQIMVSLSLPYGDNTGLFGISSSSGAAVVLSFTNGGTSLTFTMADVRFAPRSPDSPYQQEVMLPLEGEAYSSDGTTEALVTTLDSAP